MGRFQISMNFHCVKIKYAEKKWPIEIWRQKQGKNENFKKWQIEIN